MGARKRAIGFAFPRFNFFVERGPMKEGSLDGKSHERKTAANDDERTERADCQHAVNDRSGKREQCRESSRVSRLYNRLLHTSDTADSSRSRRKSWWLTIEDDIEPDPVPRIQQPV